MLGAVTPGEPFTAPVHWNKMIVVVSREDAVPPVDAPRWSGPEVLIGRRCRGLPPPTTLTPETPPTAPPPFPASTPTATPAAPRPAR